ncbi:hypothetical protein D3C75_661750 [compost metagenome]
MYQYLLLFREMGLRVVFAGYDFTRYEPYTYNLEKNGIEVISGSIDEFAGWLVKNGPSIDYAYINRPHVGEQFMDAVRSMTPAKIIYNSVDFGFLREERRGELEGNPLALSHAAQLKEKEMALFAKSDVVYTFSEYEKALLEAELPGIRVVAVPLLFGGFPYPSGLQAPLPERSVITFIGGFNHSPNVDGILWFVREIWPLICQELPDALFVIMGSNPPPQILELNGNGIWVAGNVPDDVLEWFYSRTRVVVAPLRYGAGVKGKIIEAVERGIPVVTTSMGAEGIKEADTFLRVADFKEEFALSVTELYRNDGLWQHMRDRQTNYAGRYLTTDYAMSVLAQDIVP